MADIGKPKRKIKIEPERKEQPRRRRKTRRNPDVAPAKEPIRNGRR